MKLTIRKRTLGTIPLLEVVEEARRNDTLPLIVYYHGWQSSKELVLTQGRYLAEAGFRVCCRMRLIMGNGNSRSPRSLH